jgi:ABC-type nitrate/sulfonate/bicarbonate transport system permease component
MAAPSDLPPAYARYWNLFVSMGWQTLWRTVLGLVLAVIFGTLLGMIMGFSRIMRDALYPLLVGFNAIPKATVVPSVALMFVGQHDFNTVLLAFMISFFPIAVSVSIGLSTLEPEYRDILRSLGRVASHDFLENRAAQNAAGIFRRAESGRHAGLYRHQSDGDRQPPWPRPWRALLTVGAPIQISR